jgi:hypothetical protein
MEISFQCSESIAEKILKVRLESGLQEEIEGRFLSRGSKLVRISKQSFLVEMEDGEVGS